MNYQHKFIAYDTLCSVSLASDDETKANELLTSSKNIALKVQSILNMYDPESELSKLCRDYEVGKTYRVSAMLLDFLRWNKRFYLMTDGLFDPTVGPLMRLWDFLADDPEVPTEDAIRAELRKVGYDHVHLTDDGCVMFDQAGIVVDPGASGKGYALKLVVDYLTGEGIYQALVDFGGNMYSIGGKEESGLRPWKLAIVDPDSPDSYIGTVELEDCGIATSSWYEHCFRAGSRIFHHLLNPRTGHSEPLKLKSVTVLSSNAAFTDFLSTSIFLVGEEKGIELVEKLREKYHARIDYVMVREDGTICSTEGVFKECAARRC